MKKPEAKNLVTLSLYVMYSTVYAPRPNPIKNMVYPYAGVDYNLTLWPVQSRLQHIYHGQPYARVDFIPKSRTLDLASGARSPVPYLLSCLFYKLTFIYNCLEQFPNFKSGGIK
jgi:hypothetical protein